MQMKQKEFARGLKLQIRLIYFWKTTDHGVLTSWRIFFSVFVQIKDTVYFGKWNFAFNIQNVLEFLPYGLLKEAALPK